MTALALTLVFYCVLDGFALGPHIRNVRPGDPHPDSWGNFELDLLVVDHTGDFANKASAGEHAVAAAKVLQEIFVLLCLIALRPNHQKIGDDKNQREGDQRREHVANGRRLRDGRRLGSLGVSRRKQILLLLLIFSLALPAAKRSVAREYSRRAGESNGGREFATPALTAGLV